MISDILSQAKQDIQSYLLEDDHNYSKDSSFCDRLWALLQEMETIRAYLDNPSAQLLESTQTSQLRSLLEPMVQEYVTKGDSVEFKRLLEQAARHINIV